MGTSPVELRLLGPLELWVNGQAQRIGSPVEKRILAILLMAEGRPVPVGQIIDRVWDGVPPPTADETIQSHLSRLRRRLARTAPGAIGITHSSSGTYAVTSAHDVLDLHHFRRLAQDGRRAAEHGDLESAAVALRQAESLHRGEPLAGLTGVWAHSIRERLREELWDTTKVRIHLELALGRHAQLVSELKELAARNPVVESVVADLMLALHRCGRTPEALAAYRSAHARLRDESGLEPGADLRDLHRRLLNGDPTLLRPTPATAHQPDTPPLDNLVRDIPDFSGRKAEISLLLKWLSPSRGQEALPIALVHGMPGVGKTTLVVRVANRLRQEYPSRLYLNLRAYNSEQPREPSDALGRLLAAVGIRQEELPADVDERAALWRETIARRQAIIVLDDARDAHQVRPLLPGTSRCAVLVTSRHQLPDLEGVRSLHLDVPSLAEAAALLTRVASRGRISDQSALRRAVELCGCLPLALALVAARFRHQLGWHIADLADQLSQAHSPLDEIDVPVGIASAFNLGYSALHPEHQRVFRLLALHPGPDFTLGAVVALTARSATTVRRTLRVLIDGHLVEELTKERYRLHQLMGDFALRMSKVVDTKADRDEALGRVLDYYLGHADVADRISHPHRHRLNAGVVTPQALTLTAPEDSDAWFDLERGNLLAATRAALTSSPQHAVLFPHVLAHTFMTWGVWDTAIGLYRAAIGLCGSSGDPLIKGQLLVEIAAVLWSRGALDEALGDAHEALSIGQRYGDAIVSAQALMEIGRGHLISGRRAAAVAALDQAVALSRTAHYPRGMADALNLRGIAHSQAGEFHQAVKTHQEILETYLKLGDRLGTVKALINVGETLFILCAYEPARTYFERALPIARKVGRRIPLSNLYTNLGNVHGATGDERTATSYHQRALTMYRSTRDLRGEADVLVSMGRVCLANGRGEEAGPLLTEAEAITRRIGDQHTRQLALLGIGETHLTLCEYESALAAFHQAWQVAEKMAEPFGIAQALDGLGRVTMIADSITAAHGYLERALALYLEMSHPYAEAVRRILPGPGAAH